MNIHNLERYNVLTLKGQGRSPGGCAGRYPASADGPTMILKGQEVRTELNCESSWSREQGIIGAKTLPIGFLAPVNLCSWLSSRSSVALSSRRL
jgi:hypothetical protein